MKRATSKSGGRGGTFVVVDRSLRRYPHTGAITPTIQAVLDVRNSTLLLEELHQALESGAPETLSLRPGDDSRIEITMPENDSVFCAIDQRFMAPA